MQQYVFLHLSVIKQRYCSSYLIHVYLKFTVSRLSECMGVMLYFIYLFMYFGEQSSGSGRDGEQKHIIKRYNKEN